ncbi:TetR/AcrR family transcriptional regulator [Azospirillum endophyticum]
MRVSKEKAAKNREALLSAASRLFRERGIDGVGVAEIAKEAGLTHGALYAHFKSKDELAAAAFSHGFAVNMEATREWIGDRQLGFEDLLDGYLSDYMRRKVSDGCPMAASASEIGRHDEAVSESFTAAFTEWAAMVEASLEPSLPEPERRKLAIAATTAEIGALAISRAVAKADPALSDEVLEAVRATFVDAHNVLKTRIR